MKAAWVKFGKRNFGYSQLTFWKIVLEKTLNETEMNQFYLDYILGKKDLLVKVKELISLIGLELVEDASSNPLAAKVGILTANGKISKIHQDSSAYTILMIGDEITFSQSEKSVNIIVNRQNSKTLTSNFEIDIKNYFPTYFLRIMKDCPLQERWRN